jgi:hypothetical protein
MTDVIETTVEEEAKTTLPGLAEFITTGHREEVKEETPNHKQGVDVGGVITSVVPYDATSFDDVDEYMKAETVRERISEVIRQFESITHNIMWADSEELDKVAALKALVDELDARIGKAVDLGTDSLWDFVKGVFTKPEPTPEPKTKNGLFVWKEGDRYRWFAVYSNKYRDDDFPPEILSEKSHLAFVDMVDNGIVAYPELWHWHIPGTRWGESDWVAYDTELGFSLASGFVDRGHEDEAKAIAELNEPLAVSHGLVVLERNKDDETIIEKYVSTEISDLPLESAANKLTGFSLIEAKEQDDMIPEEKRAHLRSVGMTEGKIDEIESDLEAKASEADEAGLDFKETEESQPEKSPEVEGTEKVPEAETTEDKDEVEIDDLTEPASRQEVLEAIKPITDSIVAMNETLDGLNKADDEKIKTVVEDTPAFSIAALVSQDLSVIGKEAAETDSKDGPIENETDKASITGVSWMDEMIDAERGK